MPRTDRKENDVRLLFVDQVGYPLHFHFVSTTIGTDMEVGKLHNLVAIEAGWQIVETDGLLVHLVVKAPIVVAV